MATNFDEMNVPQLLKYIEEQHGIKLPAKTTRPEALNKLKELEGTGTPSAPGDNREDDVAKGKRPKQVVIVVAEDEDPRNYVVVGLNGRNYQIKKGVPVKVPYGVYEVLKNAVEDIYTTVKNTDGSRELVKRSKLRHQFSVEEKIY